MTVPACAGFEWGVDNITDEHSATLRVKLDEFADDLRKGDVTAAAAVGADFSTVVISACGNRELQTHVDLVVARTLRVLSLTAESDVQTVWLDGYRRTLELLETGDRARAVPSSGTGRSSVPRWRARLRHRGHRSACRQRPLA